MFLDIESLLDASIPPDEELVDLIEQAFLERQISGLEADLAFQFIPRDTQICAN